MSEHSAEKDADYIPTWRVSIPVDVTARTREEAIRYALDDLRDPTMDWDYFEVQQMDGPHPKHGPGLCPICGHYGDDCEGYVIPPKEARS